MSSSVKLTYNLFPTMNVEKNCDKAPGSSPERSLSADGSTDDWGASFLPGSDKSDTDWERIFDQIIQSHKGTETYRYSNENKPSSEHGNGESALGSDDHRAGAQGGVLTVGLHSSDKSSHCALTRVEHVSQKMYQPKEEKQASNRSRDLDSFDIDFSFHESRFGTTVETGEQSSGKPLEMSRSLNLVLEEKPATYGASLIQRSPCHQAKVLPCIEGPTHTSGLAFREKDTTECTTASNEMYVSKGSFYDTSSSESASTSYNDDVS